jgi:hypothetical protein
MGSIPLVASTSHELTVVDALWMADEGTVGTRVSITTPLERVVVISTEVGAGAELSTEVMVVAADSVIQGYECCPPCPEVHAVLSAGTEEETSAVG